jgi:predicted SAM-dependent methyltransferase
MIKRPVPLTLTARRSPSRLAYWRTLLVLRHARVCRVTSLKAVPSREKALRLLAGYVAGAGIELGPGHLPFPLPYPGAKARYVDRWKPDESQGLFPELGESAGFPMPDIVADLNVDRLSMLADESEDFVIASHVLEHLVDPLAQLAEIHRVLRPGGVALILLPDRRLTFDRARQPTTLDDLVADHASGAVVPDDAHLEEFLIYSEGWNNARDAAKREVTFEFHRQRSFHVHCWTQEEFVPVLRYSIATMHMSWELLDALFVDDVPDGNEYGFVLRRSLSPCPSDVLGERLDDVWAALLDGRRTASQRMPAKATALRRALRGSRAYRAGRRQLRPVKRYGLAMAAKVRRRLDDGQKTDS